MEITVCRQHFNDRCTIGEVTTDSGYEFHSPVYSLEDTDRRLSQTDPIETIKKSKVFGQTAIPYGRYEVIISFSDRFKKLMPLLLNVPGFDGVRIHPGNTDADTHGCLLVGYQKDVVNNQVLQSKPAYAELFNLIQERIRTEKVFINYVRAA